MFSQSKRWMIGMCAMLLLSTLFASGEGPKKVSSKSTNAMVPKAAAGNSAPKSWVMHRFELSFQAGGVLGGNLGEPQFGDCVPAVTGGCDDSLNLHHDNTNQYGVYPGLLGGLKYFQRRGGIQPGHGGVWGLRFGVNVNPRWQVEFIYNHLQTATAFTNQQMLDLNIQTFNLESFGDYPRYNQTGTTFDGHAKGNQNQYLFNINRIFNAGGRVQPYIGGGAGWEDWYAGPLYSAFNVTQEPATASFVKGAGSSRGFAFDIAAGAKFYLTNHFGVRADAMDVFSFPGIDNKSVTTLISGGPFTPGVYPISGTVHQDGRFNQMMFTGGIFYGFGGDMGHGMSGSSMGDDSSRWFDRWELSVNFGGVHGWRNGHQASTCTPASGVPAGCDLNDLIDLGHDFSGIYASRLVSTVPTFLARGGITPGDGWTSGLRLAYNLNRNWDVSFIWQVMTTGTAFDNRYLLDQAQTNFDTGDINATPPRSAQFVGNADGHPRGNQSAYLFNIDRNFHVSKRFVPYVGAGLGWESWSGGPRVDLHQDVTGSNIPNVADFTKNVRGENAFAFDIAGGMKYYLTRHFGVRADVMDVFSFNTFDMDFASIDTSGLLGTPGAATNVSGRLSQENHISQLVTTAGVFWSFANGGEWKAEKKAMGTVSHGPNAGRFELSFQTGGILGGNLGQPDFGDCTSTAVAGSGDGCDPNQRLKINSSGIYPGVFGAFRNFQRFGGVQAGDGGFYGARVAWNIKPTWSVEFIWNHAQTNTAFTNTQPLLDATSYRIQRFSGAFENAKGIETLGNADGSPRGNQNMYLVNINRNFNVAGRIVPYVGVGGGAVSWFAGPAANFFVSNTENDAFSQFYKYSGSNTGGAFDLATGAKIWLTDNFGVRADFMNVMSWADLTHNFASIDLSDFQGFGAGSFLPVSGHTTQHGMFNQALFSGGIFWSIGGRMDTSAYKNPTGDRESLNDHWEISFTGGGVHGSQWGNSGADGCVPAVSGGCDLTQNLAHRGSVSVFPGRLSGTLPFFMEEGGIQPGDGWTAGMQVAYNFNPRWQVAFIYNFSGIGMRFQNEAKLQQSLDGFWAQCDCDNPRALNFVHDYDGTARGDQQQWLINLNRNFRTERRVVPYIGMGLGETTWNNNPIVVLITTTNGPNRTGTGNLAAFNKGVPNETSFSLDVAGGVKFYLGRHWGLRADMMNVVNFADFHPKFSTIDISGIQGTGGATLPISGSTTQTTRFNTVSGTGGFFFTF